MADQRERYFKDMALVGGPEVRSKVLITYPVWNQFRKKLDWKQAEKHILKTKSLGEIASCGTDYGFIYLRLTYIRDLAIS